jgi:hypothetical protein
VKATASRDAGRRRSRNESRSLFDNRICSSGESVGLKAHENTFAVIVASATGLCVTLPFTNHATKCHTMPSNFPRNSLKTKKSSTNEVSHFFKGAKTQFRRHESRATIF